MGVHDAAPVSQSSKLLFFSGLAFGGDASGTYVLTNASSVAAVKQIFVMDRPVRPEDASLVARVVAASRELDLAVLSVPSLNRPPAPLALEQVDTANSYTVLGFVHERGIALDPSPAESPPVPPAATRNVPPGPPFPDVIHGGAAAEGALLNACAQVVAWHSPSYAFAGSSPGGSFGVSSLRIAEWLTKENLRFQRAVPCPSAQAPFAGSATVPDMGQPAASAATNGAGGDPATPASPRRTGPLLIIVALVAGLVAVGAWFAYQRQGVQARHAAFARASELLQQASPARAEQALPAGRAWQFRGRLSNGKHLRFSITSADFAKRGGSLVIGRDAKHAQVVIDDESLSRAHARLRYDDGLLSLEDLRSTNGVSVGGRKLPSGQVAQLGGGDKIELGSVKISVKHLDRPS